MSVFIGFIIRVRRVFANLERHKMKNLMQLGLSVGLLFGLMTPIHAQEALVIGNIASVAVGADAPTSLTFAGVTGETVLISTRADASDELDTVLRLIAPSGFQIAYNDDTLLADGTERNAQLLVTLPEDGEYTLLVDSFNGVSEGITQVTLEKLNPFGDDVLRIVLLSNRVYASAMVVKVEGGEVARFVIRVRDLNGGLDPTLRVYDADGSLIARADDQNSQTTLNSLDVFLVLEELSAGTYTLEITDFLGRAGELELIVEPLTSP